MAKNSSLDQIELEEKVKAEEEKETGRKILDMITVKDDKVEAETEEKDEKDKLLVNSDPATGRRSYDDDYSKLLQLKQEMVEMEKSKKPWENKALSKFVKSFGRDKKILVVVAILFVIIITGLIVIYRLHEEDHLYMYKGKNLMVNEKSLHFEIKNELKEQVLSGQFWKSKLNKRLPYDCSKVKGFQGTLCLYWKRIMKLSVISQSWSALNMSCYKVSWLREKEDLEEQDCFDMKGSTWFGGGLMSDDGWPLNQLSFSKQPFVTGNSQNQSAFGEVLDKYWVSSNGVGIFVDDGSEIQISINKTPMNSSNEEANQLCIYSKAKTSNLKYTVCVAPNMTAIHQNALPLINPPPKRLQKNQTLVNFTTPIWSTRSFLNSDYNQDKLIKFSNNISKFEHETLLIDIAWENQVGDLSFDANKFPNVSSLMNSLHSLNFKVCLAVHTYIEPRSPFFQEARLKEYLVKENEGQVPGLTLWTKESLENKEKMVVGVLDLSENATNWFKGRLEQLQSKYSIDSLHFVGGSVSSLPSQPSSKYLPSDPNQYTHLHNQLSSSLGALIPVETAYKSQSLDVVVKMKRTRSTWAGIQSVIPFAFSLSLVGYNVFIPEAAGGSIDTELLSKELYIRWMQLNVFLPFVHFSIPPDHFDKKTVDMFHSLSEFRTSIISPVIQSFYENENTVHPLIQPLWWYSPHHEDALSCLDEFVVANKFLFAPILESGSTNRNVFFPRGIWEDKPNDVYHIGPKWVFNYTVPLNTFIYFVKK